MPPKLSNILDIAKAYEQVLYEEKRGEDFIPDVLRFADTRSKKKEMIDTIRSKIHDSTYEPGDLLRIEIPKSNFCIRRAARPCLEDWVVYQALTNYIGFEAESKLKDCVYSCRFDRKKKALVHSVKQWLDFQKDFWLYYEKGYEYVLVTDITSYFANINLEKLRKSLSGIISESSETECVISYLFNKLLRAWSKTELNEGFGIPQGITASSILGNLFLHRVDLTMSREPGIKYLRYVDDIRVLAKDKRTAKIGLKKLIECLRELGLDVNDKKTDILEPQDAKEQLLDRREEDLNSIDRAIRTKNETAIATILPIMIDLFNKSFDEGAQFAERHLRFCVRRFVRLRRLLGKENAENISSRMLTNLVNLACLTDLFCRFLKSYSSDMVRKRIFKFLRSEDNIYEWQEMWLLDTLLRFRGHGKPDIKFFAKVAFDRNKHPVCRSKAIVLLGRFSDAYYRRQLTGKFATEENYLVKRAIVIAAQGLNSAERKDFYRRVKEITDDHSILIDYLKGLAKPVYFSEAPEPEIEIEEEPY